MAPFWKRRTVGDKHSHISVFLKGSTYIQPNYCSNIQEFFKPTDMNIFFYFESVSRKSYNITLNFNRIKDFMVCFLLYRNKNNSSVVCRFFFCFFFRGVSIWAAYLSHSKLNTGRYKVVESIGENSLI